MAIQSITSSNSNSQTLLWMYWTLNSDEISKIPDIETYGTRKSDFIFLDFGDDKQDADPLLLKKHHYRYVY